MRFVKNEPEMNKSKKHIFATDEVEVTENENDSQRRICDLEKAVEKYYMKISSKKTRMLAFKGKNPVRSKIVIRIE